MKLGINGYMNIVHTSFIFFILRTNKNREYKLKTDERNSFQYKKVYCSQTLIYYYTSIRHERLSKAFFHINGQFQQRRAQRQWKREIRARQNNITHTEFAIYSQMAITGRWILKSIPRSVSHRAKVIVLLYTTHSCVRVYQLRAFKLLYKKPSQTSRAGIKCKTICALFPSLSRARSSRHSAHKRESSIAECINLRCKHIQSHDWFSATEVVYFLKSRTHINSKHMRLLESSAYVSFI